MNNRPDKWYVFKRRIDEAEQSDQIIAVLNELAPWLVASPWSQEQAEVIIEIFQALKVLTEESVSEGEHIIRTYLLDYLEKDSDASALQKSITRQLRECLEEWIAHYPEQDSLRVREHIVEDLLSRFRLRPSQALCWTVAFLEYREPQIARELFAYALSHEDEVAETALVTLTALGVPFSERSRLLEVLHQRIRRQVSQPLLVALYRLADSSSVGVVAETCFLPKVTLTLLERALPLQVLSAIAAAHCHDEGLQDRIWALIARFYQQAPPDIARMVNLGGEIAPKCDSKAVVPTLLTWIGQATDESTLQERYPLLSYRLEECVRPRQVASWQQKLIPSACVILRQFACQDSKSVGRSRTREMYLKEAAWGTILRMGYTDALGWFEEAVGKETNPYLRGILCDLFACFRLDPLPNSVLGFIKTAFDVMMSDTTGKVSAEVSVRLGAMKVARSAASMSALGVLLQDGLTLDGQPLLASVDALADVACAIARKSTLWCGVVVFELVKTMVGHERAACRVAAGRALEILASEQELDVSLLEPLRDIVRSQQNRTPFELSLIVSTLALQPTLLPGLIPQLKQWALEREDELARVSFSILAQHGQLLEETFLLQRLHLYRDGQVMRRTSGQENPGWQMYLIGLLYQQAPTLLLPLVAELVETLPWTAVVQLLRGFRAFDDGHPSETFPEPLALALIKRVRQRQTRAMAELDLIRLVARLLPEEFARESWEHIWQDWLPQARAVLADALGVLQSLSEAAREQQVRCLQMLMSDGHYLVRRASYRGLQRCAPELLHQWCWAWADSNERSLRLRAAEVCGWLLPEEEWEETVVTLFQQLATDPEPQVRQAAQRAQHELRKRLWAQVYLAQVMNVVQKDAPSNADVLAAWPYAEALKRVGDDTTIHTLRTMLKNQALLPHIRHWCQLILKETSEGWEKAMKKWPEPGTMWSGSLEAGNGKIQTPTGEAVTGHYVLWRDDPVDLMEVASWGGTFQAETPLQLVPDGQLFLQREDGRRAKILLKETSLSGAMYTFIGQGSFLQ